MAQVLHNWRGAAYEERNTAGGAIAPSTYDALQFFDRGTLVIAAPGGGAFTLPSDLPIGFKMRVVADTSVTSASTATLALDATYTVISEPAFTAGPYALLPGGGFDIEIISTNRILLTAVGAQASAVGARVVATRTALAAITAANRYDGMIVTVLSDNSRWRYNATSALAADYTGTVAIAAGAVTAANLVLVPADAPANGRWIRADNAFIARIPFVQATANAAVLWTPPAGVGLIRLTGLPFWDITAFTAGDGARRIGASSSSADGEFTVVGDLLGGTGGQLPVLGITPGVLGDAFGDADTANTSLATVQKLLMPLGTGTTGIANVRYDIMAAGTDTADGMICIPVAFCPTAATIS